MTLHPTVPNPYTLLSLLPPRTKVYTCLDLKDAFFCINLAPASQPIFAFEWEDPVGGTKQQLTWTPPQGFKNSPTIFGEALASDLDSFHPKEYGCWLLQYLDDLLLAGETKEKCWERKKALPQLLMEAGYPVLKKKAQICKNRVRLSWVCFKKGHKIPDPSWVLYTDGTSLIKQGQRLSG